MGRPASYSYFVGCSDGGREALQEPLQEAQRFPGDFDGITVGSPVNDQVGEFASSYLYNMQATLGGPQTNGVPDAYIPSAKLPLLTNAALAQCVGKDGGVATDAFLSDPRQCSFDPGAVECKAGQDPSTCLTSAQVHAHYNNVPAQGVQFQRPLCPYPQRAEYAGNGDPNDAQSFACVAHHDPFDPRNIGPQLAYKEGR